MGEQLVSATSPERDPAPQPPPALETGWAYIRHELLYISWAMMEVALIAPLALLVMSWARFWPAPLFTIWLLLLMLIPFNLSRVMSLAEIPLERQRTVLLLALLAAIFFSLRALLYQTASLPDLSWLSEIVTHFVQPGNPFWARDLGVFFLVIIVWWRGIRLTRRRVDVADVGRRLRAGGLLFAPLVLGLSMLPDATPSTAYVLLFFLVGLVSVALTRAEGIALQHTGASYAMRPGWIGVVFLTSLLIVTLAGLLALVLGSGGVPQLLHWLQPLWDAFFFLTMVVITTTTYLFLLLLRPLQWLVSYLFRLFGFLGIEGLPQLEEPPQELTDTDVDQFLELFRDTSGPPLFWVNRGLTILIIAVIFLVLWLTINRYFRGRAMAQGYEPTRSAQDEIEAGGLNLGQRLLRRFGLWRDMRKAASLRRLYRQMCEMAASRGYPRASAQTPYEYLRTLDEAWPQGQHETRLITTAYVRVRYGELPETEEEMAEIYDAWQRLSHMEPPEYDA